MPQKLVATAKVGITEHLQTRQKTNHDYVDSLAERIEAGDELPAIQVVTDGESIWLCDGHHRLLAAEKAGVKIQVFSRNGSRQDAVILSLAANSTHGMRRSNADKRRVVELAIKEFPKFSARKIADICVVSNTLVSQIKAASQTETVNIDSAKGDSSGQETVNIDSPVSGNTINQESGDVEWPETEQTPAEVMAAWNSEVEKYARGLMKYAKENMPDGVWMDESTVTTALRQLKSAAGTIRTRQGKGPCPICTEGCERCKQTGWMPRYELEVNS